LKPFDSLGLEEPRWVDFVLQRQQRLVAVFGLRDPYEKVGATKAGVGLCIFPSGDIDYEYHLTACQVCGEIGFEYDARGARACADRKGCYGRLDADKGFNPDAEQIMAAIIEARGQFCGAPISLPGRTLTDAQVETYALQALEQERKPGGVGKWITNLGLSPADRDAVLRAWGRLTE
jgi:hypothetical protein